MYEHAEQSRLQRSATNLCKPLYIVPYPFTLVHWETNNSKLFE